MKRSDSASSTGGEPIRNRLAQSHSPYLLQHAANPVDWYPWGDEAFERARAEDKPVFLSVGYSTCHWCHVMAHESFEDAEVADLMNEAFVSIKVDREERPDIDQVYMTVCQMMTGGGGWPLTILMTPDRQPFFAATYVPKYTRLGRMGMMDLIPRIKVLWQTRRNELLEASTRIVAALRAAEDSGEGEVLDESTLELAYRQLARQFDPTHGGFGAAPKFPTPHVFMFLLRYWRRTGNDEARKMVETSLRAMQRGGIHDQVGFGFHRYSTDQRWLVPHFEKMLYDQALLALAYLEAYQATGAADLGETARRIFTYVLRDLSDPAGGFHSAEDADSEGVEGKFYVWTEDEIRQLLEPEEADLVLEVFGIERAGNFREEATGSPTGANIPYRRMPLAAVAERQSMRPEEVKARLERARRQLFDHRDRRVRPSRDDKVLADWNGLMIGALARGSVVLEEPAYADAATRAARFLLGTMRTREGRLLHRYRDRDAGVPGMLDDYAFVAWGLIELYEATFAAQWLGEARELTGVMLAHFWDSDRGGLFTTADDAETTLVRQKTVYDGALPSGNSVAMCNLLRLARMTGDSELEQRAAQLARAFSAHVKRAPSVHTQLMVALDFALGPTREVVIAGDSGSEETWDMIRALRRTYDPHKVVLLRPTEEPSPAIVAIAPFTRDQISLEGHPTAYVCRGHACERPTSDIQHMLGLLAQDLSGTP